MSLSRVRVAALVCAVGFLFLNALGTRADDADHQTVVPAHLSAADDDDDEEEDWDDRTYDDAGEDWGNRTSDESRLFTFVKKRYQLTSTTARPLRNSSRALRLDFALTLYQIIDVDEKNEVLTSKVWKSHMWTDEFLRWNPDDYGGIRTLNIAPKTIWTPDIILYNNVGEEKQNFNALINIYYDGRASWSPSSTYRSSCEIDMGRFPFDEQTCKLTFGSWSYDDRRLDVRFGDGVEDFDMSSYSDNSEWQLVSTSAVRIERKYNTTQYTGTYIEMCYRLTIRRRVGFYIYVLIVPSLLLSLLTPLLFCIPPSRPDRTTLGMNLFASFFVLLLILVQSSPSSASVSNLGLYYCFSMTLIALTTMLSCLIVYVNHNYQTQPVPRAMHSVFITCLSRLFLTRAERDSIRGDLVTPAKVEDASQNQPVESMSNPASWKMIVIVLDRVCFTASTIAVGVAIAVLFPR